MGSPRSFVCKDCKKDYYLGYGCSPSWMTENYIREPEHLAGPIESPTQYDAWHNESDKSLQKNLNFRQCLVEHQGHDWFIRDDENDDIHNPDKTKLVACYATGIVDSYETLVESDWDKYEYIDMTKEAA